MQIDQINPTEVILDIGGQPLAPDADLMLRAIDKFLTLGAYYSEDHSQYLNASEEAAQTIADAIRPRLSLPLEITSEGLLILGQTVNSRLRYVHQIHELLVPLNIARLDIDACLTGADLRMAVKVLHEHRQEYGQTQAFREILIEGLPYSIRTVSVKVLENSRSDQDNSSFFSDHAGLADVKDMVENWGRKARGSQSEELAKEFMSMVTAILSNLETQYNKAELAGANPNAALSLTADEVEQLRASFQRLVEVNPSPKALTRLITHARAALDLSKDTIKADLVFQVLRGGIKEVQLPDKKSDGFANQEVKYTMEVADLKAEVDRLEQTGSALPAMPSGAASAHMGMCLSLLGTDPPDSLRKSLEENLVELFKEARAGENILSPCRNAVLATLESGFTEWVDDLVASLTLALRRGKKSLLGEFWAGLKPQIHETDLIILWPHLVNDILLGLGRVDGPTGREVLTWAGSLTVGTAEAQLDRLTTMPAVQMEKASGDLFKAPLAAMYSVYRCLAQTPLAPWVSQGLFRRLKSKPTDGLTRALMGAMEHSDGQMDFYLELIAASRGQDMPPAFREKAAFMLMGILSDLPQVRRQEKWVPGTLSVLADLQVESAIPLFREILESRRMLMLKAWPEKCRQVASKALKETGNQHG